MKTKLNGLLAFFMVLVVQISFAQTKTVTGTVTDPSGIPLPGVNIIIQGTSTGTQTDFDGNYSLSANEGDIFAFSYLGFQDQEITVGASNTINARLESGEQALDEVIVTAIGIKRKPRELTSSVAQVDADQLTQTKTPNVATAIVGKVSGLQINTVGNGVNPDTRIQLRGNRSLLGDNQALIVIDGFPSPRDVLNRINPNDIESINVLKGANAAALYGAEATNGVVIVNTKQGQGKLSVTYTNSYQIEKAAYLPEFQDKFGAGGFPDGTLYPLENVNWGPRYDGRLVEASETLDDGRVLLVPFTPIKDRNKDFFDTGGTVRHGLSFSGGDDKGDFLFSIDQTNTDGITPKDRYNRTNVRLKGSRKFDKLEVSGNVSFFRSHSNVVSNVAGRQGRPVYWNLINTPLHIPLNDPAFDFKNWRTGEFTSNEVSYYRFYENPYFIIDTQRESEDINQFNLLSTITYNFTDWLSATVRSGYNTTNTRFKRNLGGFTYNFRLQETYSSLAEYGPSTIDQLFSEDFFNNDVLLQFDKQIADDFSLKVTLGNNIRIQSTKRIRVGGDNLIIPGFYNISTRTGELSTGLEESTQERRYAVYGDMTLGFKDYLFLNATARNDWSSTLPEGNRDFFYPSVGLSFVPSDAFPGIKSDNGISYLKVNGSVTKTGNDPGLYATQGVFFSPTNFPYGSTVGLSQSNQIASPTLNPEFTTSYETGFELSMFKNRLNFNTTVYKQNSTDQIIPVNVALSSGASSAVVNVGEIENRGIEIDLNGTILRTSDFSWRMGLNYTGYDSEVLSLTDGVDQLDIGGFAAAQIIAQVGEPYPQIRTTAYQRDPQGRIIVGADGDPLQDANNQIQGKTTPDYVVGLNTNIKYKNWSLYAVADYRTGHVFYNNLVDALEFTGLTQHSAESDRQPFVFPNSSYADGNGGFTANTTRPTSGGGNAFWDSYNDVKENYVTDATTLKLREVSLSYNFGDEIISKIGVDNISLSIFGRNLITLRPEENVYTDPEFNFTTGNAIGVGTQAQTPPTRSYGMSLTVRL